MLRIGSIVWGVQDVPRGVAFWTAALNYRPREEPDDTWAVLIPAEGTEGVQIALARVGSEKARRHHLDLYATDQAAEVERLVALGATRVEWRYPPDADYVVLADPDGNRFCVIDRGE
ncbi:VOC family protein [Deinococcus yunweiensis]|uniref:VOC family protein n=1 Tax=Deinococcus yunweiensis TaxID=367282 RepID=UPI00398EF6A2